MQRRFIIVMKLCIWVGAKFFQKHLDKMCVASNDSKTQGCAPIRLSVSLQSNLSLTPVLHRLFHCHFASVKM